MDLYQYLSERYPRKLVPADSYHLSTHELLDIEEIKYLQQFKVKGFVEIRHLYKLLIE